VNDSTVVIESQTDWLTATCKGPEHWYDWITVGERLLWEEQARGNKRQAWGLRGYRGSRCGRAATGSQEGSNIIALSGDLAAIELSNVVPLASHVSRLDVAVTLRLTDGDGELEARLYGEYIGGRQARGRPVKASLVQASDGGATFYLGSRSSERFCRVYNKAVESGEARYERCHRAELELKGDVGDRVAHLLLDVADRPAWCQAYTHRYLTEHGLTPPFPTSGSQTLVPGFSRRSDADTRLAWVAQQVAPTVDWLLRTGHADALERALGVSLSYVAPSSRPGLPP